MLKLQFVDGSRESIWLVEPRLRFGKHADNNVVIDQPNIEDFHAEIRLKDDELYLLNLKPEYLVGVNGKRVNKAVKIQESDVIQLGQTKLKVVHPSAEHKHKPEEPLVQEHNEWGLQATASWASQSFYPIKESVIIGRDEQCDITVPVSHLSRQHAQLTVAGSYLLIKDLGSTNGTYLNGERITQGRAKPGDKLRFDVVNFTVTGPIDDSDLTIVRPGSIGAPAAASSKPAQAKAAKAAPRPKPAPKPETAKPSEQPSYSAPEKTSSGGGGVLLYTVIGFVIVFAALSAFFFLK
ncbi:phosphopeptide-binding protein [Hahella sp. CCB-MM4]|uniref:FHA domain-containing protein n=1 Tax=Hahella sp. (strain CCB-MM4) TaxID=1926491 RepID=UPI000B9C7506|nr:FHA domain-containing protein [Hahella sp. CCB-MM4]OZG75368.1 phosphopeptide-binding protein [Hahella sp. CCB-MM4]